MRTERLKKTLRLFPPVPDRHNFLSLLKEARADGQVFIYRRVPWGNNLTIHPRTVKVIVDILRRVDEEYKENLLDLVPLEMTRLAMSCWALQNNQVRYRHMFKRITPTERKYYQYEFAFMEEKNDITERHDPFDEGCPLCGKKTH